MTNYAEQRHYRMPATGDVWRHYKGDLYTVVGMARDAEAFANVVYTPKDWALVTLPPLFNQRLERWLQEMDVSGTRIPRFIFHGREKYHCCAFIKESSHGDS